MHRDLERLRDLRWDTKVALSVLDEAIYILHEKGSLSSKDLAGLNARIADRSCRINPDGTFTCNTRKAVALKEAREALYNVLAGSEEDIERTEKETREKEQQCHQMNQRLAGLEDWVEKECRATNSRRSACSHCWSTAPSSLPTASWFSMPLRASPYGGR